jgi:hypothetical protein
VNFINKSVENTDYHVELEKGFPQVIDVVPEAAKYCKVDVKGRYSPCFITFSYPDRKKKYPDLYVFISYKHKLPDKSNAKMYSKRPFNLQVTSKGFAKMPPEFDTSTFRPDFMYMALESCNGCRVKISVEFNLDEIERKKIIAAQEKPVSTLPNIEWLPSTTLIEKNVTNAPAWKDILKRNIQNQ